jgi:RNA polymerase sigma-70 factor (ECF subfamily)
LADRSDRELVHEFRTGSSRNKAFDGIVRKYQERLYWHIRKILISHEDTDDVLQNTFLKAFEGLNGFREDASLFTWLYRIATNESLTFLKRKSRRYFLSIGDDLNQLENKLESDVYFNGDEIQMKLQKAILRLPQKQRLVFNMKYYDELKYEEISRVLDTSVGALKASYHHALKKLEKYLTED